jgi:hypothetical protein
MKTNHEKQQEIVEKLFDGPTKELLRARILSRKRIEISVGEAEVNLDKGQAVFFPNEEGILDNQLEEACSLEVSTVGDYFLTSIQRCSTGANHFECSIRPFEE